MLTAHGRRAGRAAAAAAAGAHGAEGRRRTAPGGARRPHRRPDHRARPRRPRRRPAPPPRRLRPRPLAPRPRRQGAGRPLGPAWPASRGRRASRSPTACCWPSPTPSASPGAAAARASSSWPAAAAPSSSPPTPWPASPGWRWPSSAAARRRDRILLAAPLDAGRARRAFADQFEVEERGGERRRAGCEAQPPDPARRAAIREERRREARPGADRRAPAGRASAARGPGRPALGRSRRAPARSAPPSSRPRARRLARPLRRRPAGAASTTGWPRCSPAAARSPRSSPTRSTRAPHPDPLGPAAPPGRRWRPTRWTAPTGTSLAIDYAAEAGPRVDVRVQELFGLAEHPDRRRRRSR